MFVTAVDFDDSVRGECRVGVGSRECIRGYSVYVNHPCVAANELLLPV